MREISIATCSPCDRGVAALLWSNATEKRRAGRRPRGAEGMAKQALRGGLRIAHLREPIECRCHDLGEAGGRRQVCEFGWVNPPRLAELLVQHQFTPPPAGGKAEDDEMPFHAGLRIVHDGLAKAGEGNRLDRQAGFSTTSPA